VVEKRTKILFLASVGLILFNIQNQLFMKRILLTIFSFLFVFVALAQKTNYYKKPKSLGVHVTLQDYVTAAQIRDKGMSDVLSKKQWGATGRTKAGMSISYTEGLSDNFDFNARVGFALMNAPMQTPTAYGKERGTRAYFESDANIFMKLLSDQYFISPFLSAGAGASLWQGYYAAYIPVGGGLQLNLFDGTLMTFQTQYRLPVTANNNFHLFYSMGVIAELYPRKPKPVVTLAPPVPVVVDTDKDGVPDATDKCPLVAGVAKYDGCPVPDTDKDGINDEKDKCPTVAGIAKYDGCPIPDTDKDGINDEEDKCPTVAGIAKYGGCPVPDKDGDGINDEEDRCIDIPGVAANKGCPEISISSDNLKFQTGKVVLSSKATKELMVVADILQKNEFVTITIEGHTDNTGSDKINDPLSTRRANAVMGFLVKKGIEASRMEAVGYGSKNPVDSNATSKGRAKNRRVDVKVK
jgi:OOP family OmpA-OmpF porin